MNDMFLTINMELQYTHPFGKLSPYFDGLASGRAMASRCGICGWVWFPPHITCPEDGGKCEWLELDGNGEVISLTKTRSIIPFTEKYIDHIFVMVAVAGANNVTFGRVISSENVTSLGDKVRLVESTRGNTHLPHTATFELLKGHE